MKIYSKGCEYALRALTQIVPGRHKERFRAREVCKTAGIPESYSRKIFQQLVHSGLLKAVPGPGGGYVLNVSPDEISLLTVIQAIDGKDCFDHCVMGLPACDDRHPCLLHCSWQKMKKPILTEMRAKTLAQLMRDVNRRYKKAYATV